MTSYNMDGLKNLNMEGLKNLGQKYKEESVEERKKRRCQLAFPAILNLASGIAMVAIGAVFHDECVGNKATLFLMVGGSILLAASSLKLLLFLIPMDCGHKTAEPLSGVLDFAYFIVAIWGSVQVFGKSSLSKASRLQYSTYLYHNNKYVGLQAPIRHGKEMISTLTTIAHKPPFSWPSSASFSSGSLCRSVAAAIAARHVAKIASPQLI